MTSDGTPYLWPLTTEAAPDVAEWVRRQFARLDPILTKDRCHLGVEDDPTANTGKWDLDVMHDPTFGDEFRVNLRLGWDALRKATDWAAAAGLTDGLPLTPTDRLIEPKSMEVDADRSLEALDRHKNAVLAFLDGLSRKSDKEKYVLLSEICRVFAMKDKAVKGFCGRHNIPTKQEKRRYRIALVPFVTAYMQDTNVRADEALRKRVAKALQLHEVAEKLDQATSALFHP